NFADLVLQVRGQQGPAVRAEAKARLVEPGVCRVASRLPVAASQTCSEPATTVRTCIPSGVSSAGAFQGLPDPGVRTGLPQGANSACSTRAPWRGGGVTALPVAASQMHTWRPPDVSTCRPSGLNATWSTLSSCARGEPAGSRAAASQTAA